MSRAFWASLALGAMLSMPAEAPCMDYITGTLIYEGVKRMLPGGSRVVPEPRPPKGRVGDALKDGGIGNSEFRVAFSPGGQAEALLISEIANAKKSVVVAAPVFASHSLANALIRARKRNLKVMLLSDARANQSKSSLLGMIAQGDIPCRVNSRYGLISHRFMIIDGERLILSGASFSDRAPKGEAGSVLVIDKAPELARSYMEEWMKLWGEAAPVKAARDYGLSVGPKSRTLPSVP